MSNLIEEFPNSMISDI